MKSLKIKSTIYALAIGLLSTLVTAAPKMHVTPQILADSTTAQQHYLPDYSFAGYRNGEQQPNTQDYKVIDVSQYGLIANDDRDDSKALIALLASLKDNNDPVIVQFKPGRYIISSIIYFDRSFTVLRGAGSGEQGTEFYFPRPLIYAPDPPELAELREYLVKLDKIQREKSNNIHLPFTQWAWSGGFFWTRIEGQRVKKYLDEYDTDIPSLATALSGVQGEFTVDVDSSAAMAVGDVIEIQWLNDKGENGSLLTELYQEQPVYIGSHHWNFANLPLSRQQVRISSIEGTRVTINAPLLHRVDRDLTVKFVRWDHLNHIGFEHFRMTFGFAKRIAHHVEQGFNGLYLTRLYDGWVDDVRITDADAGILMEEVANLTINDVVTDGQKYSHYSVQMGGVHNVLVDNLRVLNKVEHPLSFNTFATKSVYRGGYVVIDPILDQHSGVNHQNLFDDLTVHVSLPEGQRSYPLFAGGGAKYWKPSHGSFNTFWNINVQFSNGFNSDQPVLLNGMEDGVAARLVGVRGNLPVTIEYGPAPYIESTNIAPKQPSLYEYQLNKRLAQ